MKWTVQDRRAAITVRHHVHFDSGVLGRTRRETTQILPSNIVTCIVTLVHNRHFELEKTRELAVRQSLLTPSFRPFPPAAGGAAWPIGALAAELAARPTTTTPADRR